MSDANVAPGPDVPDLRTLLAEASRPWAEVTVPLNQALRAQIEALEVELSSIAADAPRKRMGAESPLTVKAREIQTLRDQMKASEVRFRFEAPTYEQREKVRVDMRGRDDADELDLRTIAAVCTHPAGVTLDTLRELRAKIGVRIFDETVKASADSVWGGDWSIPFSSAASLILGTET